MFDSGEESKDLDHVMFESEPTGHFLSSPLSEYQAHNGQH